MVPSSGTSDINQYAQDNGDEDEEEDDQNNTDNNNPMTTYGMSSLATIEKEIQEKTWLKEQRMKELE